MRLIVLAILVYVLYRLFKSWSTKRMTYSRQTPSRGHRNEVDDVMVQDPQCGAYFPSRKAVRAEVDGRRLEFCSEQCRDEYLAKQNTQSQ